MVVPSLAQGGGQKFVIDLAEGLDKTQYEVKILIYYNLISDAFKDKISGFKDIEIIKLDKKTGLDFSFFKKVKKVVKEYQPDIIHTHLDVLLYLFPVFKKHQVKLHTVHSMAEKESVGLQRWVRKIAFKWFKVKPVAISDTVCQSIKQCYKMKDVPIAYNGVSCKDYAGEIVKHEGVNIITTGRLYAEKNFKYLIDCFYEVSLKHPDVSLTLLGDGPLRDELQEQINGLGISDKVCLVGEVSNVKSYLLKADIFASSSIFEGLPLSMLEAMAAGLPIIANDVGGIHDIVKDGFNGYLVPYGAKDEYVKKLEQLVCDTEQRHWMADNARCVAVERDECKTVEAYEKLYQKKER